MPIIYTFRGDDSLEDQQDGIENISNIQLHLSPKETVIRHFVDHDENDGENTHAE